MPHSLSQRPLVAPVPIARREPWDPHGAALHRVLREWNDEPDYPVDGLVMDQVARRAAERPDAVALVAGDAAFSYGELEARAERIAVRLCRRGVALGGVVGLLLERSPLTVASILAVWRCGAAYLPLDPEHPPERMGFIVRDGLRGPGPRLVLTHRNLAEKLAELEVEVVLLEEGRSGGGAVPEPPAVEPEHPAYVIYTSGSTGRPKGIVVPHGALANRIGWAACREIGSGDSFLHKTTLTFDVSLVEIFGPLVAGARCVVAPPTGHRDLGSLAELVAREAVTHASFPPSALRLLLETPGAGDKLRSLRVLVTGGETVPPSLPALVREVVRAPLFNRYGPTETTISVVTGACGENPGDRPVPLGRPIARARVYVVDGDLGPLPPGSSGEVCIGGMCVARGYLGRPALTAEWFVPDPFAEAPGGRLYRSGDRGRWSEAGEVEFGGRIDRQVKIRGYRVELEEVERALGAHSQVREAVVVGREEKGTGSRTLVAYVLTDEGVDCDPSRLRRFLAGRLPGYMIPSAFIGCRDLPRTLSGKVDRRALAALADPVASEAAGTELPSSRLEREVTLLARELLQVPSLGPDEDLFEYGLHSLLLVRLQTRLRETLAIELSLADIARNASARGLAALLDGRGATEIGSDGLAADALWDGGVAPRQDERGRTDSVLLTGATGFLGSHVLAELLRRTDARVLCLVRTPDELHGRDAVLRALERNDLHPVPADQLVRLHVVPGDLALPDLGLSPAAFETLAEGVGAIYHCGAWVHFGYPYEVLRATNVEGTRTILRLAALGRASTIHHVSSLSVLETSANRGRGSVPEEPLGEDPEDLEGGYRQSKWAAERLVQQAFEQGLPAVIYRLGWCPGSRHTGALNLSDFLVRLTLGSLRAGLAPELGPVEVCPTPVDWSSAAIVGLSQRPDSVGKVFHVINPRPVPVDHVVDLVAALGRPLHRTPVQGWAQALLDLTAGRGEDLLAPLESYLRRLASEPPDPSGNGHGGGHARSWQPLRFASEDTAAVLETIGLHCPAVDRALLARYLAFLGRRRLLPRLGERRSDPESLTMELQP